MNVCPSLNHLGYEMGLKEELVVLNRGLLLSAQRVSAQPCFMDLPLSYLTESNTERTVVYKDFCEKQNGLL